MQDSVHEPVGLFHLDPVVFRKVVRSTSPVGKHSTVSTARGRYVGTLHDWMQFTFSRRGPKTNKLRTRLTRLYANPHVLATSVYVWQFGSASPIESEPLTKAAEPPMPLHSSPYFMDENDGSVLFVPDALDMTLGGNKDDWAHSSYGTNSSNTTFDVPNSEPLYALPLPRRLVFVCRQGNIDDPKAVRTAWSQWIDLCRAVRYRNLFVFEDLVRSLTRAWDAAVPTFYPNKPLAYHGPGLNLSLRDVHYADNNREHRIDCFSLFTNVMGTDICELECKLLFDTVLVPLFAWLDQPQHSVLPPWMMRWVDWVAVKEMVTAFNHGDLLCFEVSPCADPHAVAECVGFAGSGNAAVRVPFIGVRLRLADGSFYSPDCVLLQVLHGLAHFIERSSLTYATQGAPSPYLECAHYHPFKLAQLFLLSLLTVVAPTYRTGTACGFLWPEEVERAASGACWEHLDRQAAVQQMFVISDVLETRRLSARQMRDWLHDRLPFTTPENDS